VEPDRARELLSARRAEIEPHLRRLLAPPEDREPDTADPADVAPELLESEVGAGLVEQLRDELEAIARAESRLAEGTYGTSIESGEPIPDARLETIPWAERTSEEQARYEVKER